MTSRTIKKNINYRGITFKFSKMLGKKDMHGHQKKVSEFIYPDSKNGAMCWLDVGGGKTISSLDAIANMREDFNFGRALVVSTKRIVKDVWPQEVKLWEQTHDMTVVTREMLLDVRRNRTEPEYIAAKKLTKEYARKIKFIGVRKTPKSKMKEYKDGLRLMRGIEAPEILELKGDISLINVENFKWLVETLGTKWPYDTLIFDEFSLFRNNASKRFSAAKRIRPYVSTVIGLTGTPAPNGYMGLWAQTYLLDKGKRLGRTITEYRRRYFDKSRDGFSWVAKEGAQEIIREKIKDIVISLDPRDYMELGPEPIHEEYKLTLPDDLRTQYRELERNFFLQVEGDSIIALSQAVKSNKLRQFCNGSVYAVNEDEYDSSKKVIQIHDIKLEALKEIVEISNGNPLIVAYEYIPEKEKILKAFPKAVTIDKFDQKKWDNGEIDMLVLHPRSAGHGLNLQHGGHRVVWYPTAIDLELYNQLNGRVGQLRQAQSGYFKAPIYYHLFFENTIEEDTIRKRSEKHVTEQELISYMWKQLKNRCQV